MSLKLKNRKVYLDKSYGDKILHGVITLAPISVKVLLDGGDVVLDVEEGHLHFDLKKKGKNR